VTLLSILSCDAIAVPLSAAFPASELQYILENSEALLLLSSQKLQNKAKEVLIGDSSKLLFHISEKIEVGADSTKPCELSEEPGGQGGMMLYTSGTTSRPV
jgi:malonyl-CoA/methylmalonyl-CoA synthetase